MLTIGIDQSSSSEGHSVCESSSTSVQHRVRTACDESESERRWKDWRVERSNIVKPKTRPTTQPWQRVGRPPIISDGTGRSATGGRIRASQTCQSTTTFINTSRPQQYHRRIPPRSIISIPLPLPLPIPIPAVSHDLIVIALPVPPSPALIRWCQQCHASSGQRIPVPQVLG